MKTFLHENQSETINLNEDNNELHKLKIAVMSSGGHQECYVLKSRKKTKYAEYNRKHD